MRKTFATYQAHSIRLTDPDSDSLVVEYRRISGQGPDQFLDLTATQDEVRLGAKFDLVLTDAAPSLVPHAVPSPTPDIVQQPVPTHL